MLGEAEDIKHRDSAYEDRYGALANAAKSFGVRSGIWRRRAVLFCFFLLLGEHCRVEAILSGQQRGGRAWLVRCAHIAPPAHGPIAAAARGRTQPLQSALPAGGLG